MNNKIHITDEEMELIDRYLGGELYATELEIFEKKLDEEQGWKEKVAEIKLISLGIQEAALEQMMNEFHSGNETTRVVSIRNRGWKKWLVAASFIAVALTGLLLIFNQPQNEKLFAAYYEPDPGLPLVMGESNIKDYTLYDGMIDYKEGNYTKAIEKWKGIGDDHIYTDTLNYYIGVACINAGNINEAVKYLQSASKKQGSPYRQKAMWYLALIYIKQENKAAARDLLNKITDIPETKKLLNRISD